MRPHSVNPRSLAGSDASKPASKPAPAVKQPTLLAGATRRATALRPRRTSFNPRSCGERLAAPNYSCTLTVSTHAPCGERPVVGRAYAGTSRFNHAPLRGATVAELLAVASIKFQPTLPCGSDLHVIDGALSPSRFNPRSLRGATLLAQYSGAVRRKFHSTLPCGERRTYVSTSCRASLCFHPLRRSD